MQEGQVIVKKYKEHLKSLNLELRIIYRTSLF